MRARFLIAAGSFLLTALVLEIGARLLLEPLGVDRERLRAARALVVDGEIASYEPRAFTNFGLRQGRGTNHLGFVAWGDEIGVEKPPGVVRIACLGASTTQGGGGAGPRMAYPAFLEAILESEIDIEVEMMNWGTSGWTTAETLVNYFLNVQDYSPDIVILHHAANDIAPSLYPGYRVDYTHFRRSWEPPRFSAPVRYLASVSDLVAWIMLRKTSQLGLQHVVNYPRPSSWHLVDGKIDPTTARAFLRNLKTIAEHVRLRGGEPVLTTMPFKEQLANRVQRSAMTQFNRVIRDLAASEHFLLVDLDGKLTDDMFVDLVHMKPDGNRRKAELMADVLLREHPLASY